MTVFTSTAIRPRSRTPTPRGNNTLYASGVNATLPENVDTLYLYGSGLTGTGNDQNDSIFGDGVYSNTLIAGSGDDYIVGGSGGNTLVAGTGIDTMYGGKGANTFVFAPGDAPVNNPNGVDYIGDFKPGTDKLDFSAFAKAGHELAFIGTAPLTAPGQVDEFSSGGYTYVEGDVTSPGGADFEIQMAGPLNLQATDFVFSSNPCYCRGTLIETVRGENRIEDLKIGDQVMTKSGWTRPIKWIGRRSYSGRLVMGRKDILPVCIKAGALSDKVPKRDLWLSPHHAMFLEGVLIEAKDLVNGASILQAEHVDEVEYFHIELETHDVIVAEGALSETFIDDDSRGMFHNAHEYRRLYAQEPVVPAHYCAPRLDGGYELETIRQRIARRAALTAGNEASPGALRGFVDRVSPHLVEGWAQNADFPEVAVCLDILAGGTLVGQVLANRYRADLKHAGLGSGCHSFAFASPDGIVFAPDVVEVHRSLDGSALKLSAKAKLAVGARAPRDSPCDAVTSRFSGQSGLSPSPQARSYQVTP